MLANVCDTERGIWKSKLPTDPGILNASVGIFIKKSESRGKQDPSMFAFAGNILFN